MDCARTRIFRGDEAIGPALSAVKFTLRKTDFRGKKVFDTINARVRCSIGRPLVIKKKKKPFRRVPANDFPGCGRDGVEPAGGNPLKISRGLMDY